MDPVPESHEFWWTAHPGAICERAQSGTAGRQVLTIDPCVPWGRAALANAHTEHKRRGDARLCAYYTLTHLHETRVTQVHTINIARQPVRSRHARSLLSLHISDVLRPPLRARARCTSPIHRTFTTLSLFTSAATARGSCAHAPSPERKRSYVRLLRRGTPVATSVLPFYTAVQLFVPRFVARGRSSQISTRLARRTVRNALPRRLAPNNAP